MSQIIITPHNQQVVDHSYGLQLDSPFWLRLFNFKKLKGTEVTHDNPGVGNR